MPITDFDLTLTPTELSRLRQIPVGPGRPNRVKAALEIKGGSQSQLARMAGLGVTYVADTLRGRYSNPNVGNARKLANVFGCLVDDLFPEPVEKSA